MYKYDEFYSRSFFDLSMAKILTFKNPRNTLDLIEYKVFFLEQSVEKLFKSI